MSGVHLFSAGVVCLCALATINPTDSVYLPGSREVTSLIVVTGGARWSPPEHGVHVVCVCVCVDLCVCGVISHRLFPRGCYRGV